MLRPNHSASLGKGSRASLEASVPSSRVAVCFSGWLGVAIPGRGLSARTYLVDALQADALVAGTYVAKDPRWANDGDPRPHDCPSGAGDCLHDRISKLRAARVSLSPMLTRVELAEKLESAPTFKMVEAEVRRPALDARPLTAVPLCALFPSELPTAPPLRGRLTDTPALPPVQASWRLDVPLSRRQRVQPIARRPVALGLARATRLPALPSARRASRGAAPRAVRAGRVVTA